MNNYGANVQVDAPSTHSGLRATGRASGSMVAGTAGLTPGIDTGRPTLHGGQPDGAHIASAGRHSFHKDSQ